MKAQVKAHVKALVKVKVNLKVAALLWCLLSSTLVAQSTCDQAVFIGDSIVLESSLKSDLWIKFKAKGALLQLAVLNAKTNELLPYTLYPDGPSGNCALIEKKLLRPTRRMGFGIAELTQELWDMTLNDGICTCNNCLSRITLNPNRKLSLTQENMYLLHVKAEGESVKVHLQWSEVDKEKKVFTLNSGVESLEVGMTSRLKMVQFVASKTAYLNKNALQELDSLVNFLAQNKSVFVRIEGHVNGPTNHKSAYFLQLSDARAKKIKGYLIAQGIDQSRISALGKSNTEMKFPRPKTEWQAQQNRRVEVRIMSL